MQKATWGKGSWRYAALLWSAKSSRNQYSSLSQAAATWYRSLVSQLLYLLFHDTNLLLDTNRKLERAGCLKTRCYWHYMKWNEVQVAQSCLTLCNPVNCSPSGSCLPRILQARTLEWVAISITAQNYQQEPCQHWVTWWRLILHFASYMGIMESLCY